MAVLATATLGAVGGAAFAQATTYSNNKRTFKVGILLLDSTAFDYSVSPPTPLPGGAENPDPHVFSIADARQDIKPQNWEFINPLAPKTVSTEIYNRWSNPATGRDRSARRYQIGQAVTKDMAAYWEVSLAKTSLADLVQFDLLFITNHRLVSFSPGDREKLRKMVDAGGVLWIEDCGRMRTSASGPFFLEQLQFKGNFTGGGGAGGPVINAPSHPILNAPFPLTLPEIASLGDKNYGNFALCRIDDTNAAPNPEVLVNIVGNSATLDSNGRALPYIAVAQYGAGIVIATSGDSGCDINDYAGGVNVGAGGNSGAFCGPNIQTAHAEDLKFLYNMVQLGSANNAYRRNNRRTASSFENLGAPLLESFKFDPGIGVPANAVVQSRSAALVVRDTVYVAGRNGAEATVRAYSAKPSLTTGDRGIPDLGQGAPYDELWRVSLGAAGDGQPSSPVFGTVYQGGAYVDKIFVTRSDGSLVALPALPTDAYGNILPVNTAAVNPAVSIGSPSTYSATAGGVAPAPIFLQNRVYVVQPDSLIRCIDAATLQTLWTSYAVAQTPSIEPTGSPTLGYVRLQTVTSAASGGNTDDLMLYLPIRLSDGTASILAYWLGTRHEVVRTDGPPGSGVFRARVALDASAPANNQQLVAPGAPFTTPVVRVYTNTYSGGRLVATAQENMNAGRSSTRFRGLFRADRSGFIEVADSGGARPTRGEYVAGGPEFDNAVLSVDYDVTYVESSGAPPGLGGGNGARSNTGLLVPGYSFGLDTVALSVDDTLHYAARQNGPTGDTATAKTTLFGAAEQPGAGATRLRQAFTILEGSDPIVATVENLTINETPTLRNRFLFGPLPFTTGAVATLTPGYEGLSDIQPVGAPIVTNQGIVYFLTSAVSAANGRRVAVLLALRTQNEVVLNLPEGYTGSPKIQQFNPLTYPGSNVQTVTAQVQNGNAPVTGDAARGRITINNLQVPGGRFSTAQSFVVTYRPIGGTADRTIVIRPTPTVPGTGDTIDATAQIAAIGGGYNPLLWYYVLPVVPSSSPTLIGNAIYFVSDQGVIAVDADPSVNDPSVRVGFGEQVLAVVDRYTDASTGALQNPSINHVRWVGRLSLLSGAASSLAPPAGSNGVLAINSEAGTFAFENRPTLIADAKRLIEVAPDGSAEWTLDFTLDFRTAGGETPVYDANGVVLNPPATGRLASDRRPITRPAVTRKLSASDYLIADTGNNRVVRVDRGGQVRWQLDAINDPYKLLSSSDSRRLSAPTDVQLYLSPSPDPTDPLGRAPIGYEAHYLIADSGNFRIIEVVDYFDPAGRYRDIGFGAGSGRQVVVWVSRTTSGEGRNLRFQNVQRVLTSQDAIYGYPVLVATVINASATGVGSGVATDTTGGSLVQIDYAPLNTYFPLRNAAGPVPGIIPWPLADLTTPGAQSATNGRIVLSLDSLQMPDGTLRRVTRPTYFEQITVPNGGSFRTLFLISDASGVYSVDAETRQVLWYFDQNDYNRLNGSRMLLPSGFNPNSAADLATLPRLSAVSVKRLSSGNFLITNNYSGPSRYFHGGLFRGEVFEVTPDNVARHGGTYGGFSAPALRGVGGTNEQRMGSDSSNTSLLEQPLFADRL
jgi:hypothetical protein